MRRTSISFVFCLVLVALVAAEYKNTVIYSPMSYKNAVKHCQELNSNLLTIKSITRNFEAYLTLINVVKGRRMWIGLRRHSDERPYKWIHESDKSPVGATFFSRGQPDNHGGNERCMEMRHIKGITTGGKNWNDVRCDILNPFICVEN